VEISHDGRYLFAVNTGSTRISIARIRWADMEFRAIREDEFDAFELALSNAFGDVEAAEHDVASDRLSIEYDRTFAAFDEGRIVGCAAVYTFSSVAPGGGTVGTAGVTWVGVLPTYRRRGILTELMRRLLDQAAERGEPIATLLASEGQIYGKFGFGLAVPGLSFDVALDRVRWAPGTLAEGRTRLMTHEEARPLLQAVYERFASSRPGAVLPTDRQYAWLFSGISKPDEKEFAAVHEDADGVPDAYALYRIKHRWPRGLPSNKLTVHQVVACTPEGSASIWRFLFDIDLVSQIRAYDLALDDPLIWQMAEPRALRATFEDILFVRPIDVSAALNTRGYMEDGRVVIDVRDEFRPANTGTYELIVEGGTGSCSRTDAEPEIACAVHVVGATYFGGVSWGALARAGRLEERVAGAVERADAMFRSDVAPWPIIHF
jgi:predicted acetyltransferase